MANHGLDVVFFWSYSTRFDYSLLGSITWVRNYVSDFIYKIAIFLSSKQNDVFYVQRGFMRGLPSLLGRLSSFFQILMIFLIKHVLRRKVIFDFDDALYIKTPILIYILTRISNFVIVGSHALYQYVFTKNKRVFLIPTSISVKEVQMNSRPDDSMNNSIVNKKIKVGWLGSTSTIKNLRMLVEPLNLLGLEYEIEFRVIGAQSEKEYRRYQQYFSEFKNVKLVLIPWLKKNELKELSQFDIGVAPLTPGPWEEGKCGFKLLMYMSMGIPCVASAVGENNFIIQDGENGFLCIDTKEWIEKLQLLIEDAHLKRRIGIKGRRTVEIKYNLGSNTYRLVSIIKRLFYENIQ
jgi:glycosyltransferase involved in cell wall biosynthesis